MRFFSGGIFWFIEGALFVVLIGVFRLWLKDRKIVMKWWKWLLVVAWIFLSGFTAAFIGTNIGEGEYTSALRGGGTSAIVVLILALIIARILGLSGERRTTRRK